MVRIDSISRPISVVSISTLIFIFLNILDAWLTTRLLALGGVEAVWWSSHFNNNLLIKGVLALLIAAVLIRLDKTKMLRWLNIGMIFVVLSNGLCFLGYLSSWLYWQSQIAAYP